MTRIGTLAAAVAALSLACQAADAGPRRHRVDPRVDAVGLGVGVASTVGYFALNGWRWRHAKPVTGLSPAGALVATTAACVVASPMVATVVVRRPLTYREAHVLAVGCVLPFIGPWLVNAAYDTHPEWAAFDAPAEPKRKPRRRRR